MILYNGFRKKYKQDTGYRKQDTGYMILYPESFILNPLYSIIYPVYPGISIYICNQYHIMYPVFIII